MQSASVLVPEVWQFSIGQIFWVICRPCQNGRCCDQGIVARTRKSCIQPRRNSQDPIMALLRSMASFLPAYRPIGESYAVACALQCAEDGMTMIRGGKVEVKTRW